MPFNKTTLVNIFLFPERSPSNFYLFSKFFLLSLIIYILIYSSALIIDFAHHDQYRYFREDHGQADFKQDCSNDYQNGWLYIIGRPLAAKLECLNFRSAHQLEDLSKLRFGVLVIVSFSAALLGSWLVSLNLNEKCSFFLSASIFTLPGTQNTVFMSNYANAIVPVLCLLSYATISRPLKQDFLKHALLDTCIRLFGSGIILLLAFYSYPALAFFFFVPSLSVILLLNKSSWGKARLILIRDFIFFGTISLIYFLSHKYFIRPLHLPPGETIPEQFELKLSFDSFGQKLLSFITDVTPTILNFWNIYTNKSFGNFLGITLVLIFIALSLMPIFDKNLPTKEQKKALLKKNAEIILSIIILFVASISFWILGPANYILFRFIFVPTAIALLILFWCGSNLISILKGNSEDFKGNYLLAGTLLVVGAFFANFLTIQNSLNSKLEIYFLKTSLAKRIDDPISRIHIIRPKENSLGFNGYESITDEFNRKTSDYWQDMTELVRVALLQLKPPESFDVWRCDSKQKECVDRAPKNQILITQSSFGESIYPSKNMVLIDMNHGIPRRH